MGQESSQLASKAPGRRQLNIVYFIDSARTRSTSISMTKIYVIMFVCSLILFWAIASIFLLIKIARNNQEVQQHLQGVKQALFEYQVQYDQVFETAYPKSSHLISQLLTSQSANNEPFATRETVHGTATKSPLKLSSIDELLSPFPKADLQNPTPQANGSTKQPHDILNSSAKNQSQPLYLHQVKLENQSLEVLNRTLNLSVDMTNSTQPKKIEGHIWAIAEYTSKSGVKTIVTSPQYLMINPNTGLPKDPKSASVFAIKNFKRKVFQFKIPEDSDASLTKLSVGLIDKSGTMSRTIPLPLKFEPQVPGPLTF